MLKYLETLNNYSSIEELKKEWNEMFEEDKEINPEWTLESFISEGPYEEGSYILDTETGKCVDANEFFREIMK